MSFLAGFFCHNLLVYLLECFKHHRWLCKKIRGARCCRRTRPVDVDARFSGLLAPLFRPRAPKQAEAYEYVGKRRRNDAEQMQASERMIIKVKEHTSRNTQKHAETDKTRQQHAEASINIPKYAKTNRDIQTHAE